MSFLDSIFGGNELDRATDTLRSVELPKLSELTIKPEMYSLQGQLAPQDSRTFTQDQSAYETIQSDPRLRGSQIDALTQLMGTAQAGGLDAIARSGLEDALERQRTESRGAQEAIMANARARGIGGSDSELVGRMVAQQAQAQAGSRGALDVAALAQQRRDAALQNASQLAGSIRGVDFQQAAQKAEAADAINRFNAANRQAVENLNVGTRNDAAGRNLAARQTTADSNVDLRNTAQQYNKSLPLDLAQIRQGQAQQIAGSQRAEAAGKQERNKQIADTLTSLSKSFYGGF